MSLHGWNSNKHDSPLHFHLWSWSFLFKHTHALVMEILSLPPSDKQVSYGIKWHFKVAEIPSWKCRNSFLKNECMNILCQVQILYPSAISSTADYRQAPPWFFSSCPLILLTHCIAVAPQFFPVVPQLLFFPSDVLLLHIVTLSLDPLNLVPLWSLPCLSSALQLYSSLLFHPSAVCTEFGKMQQMVSPREAGGMSLELEWM